MDIATIGVLVSVAVGLGALASFVIAVWTSKARKRGAAVADAILGQEEVTDRSGRIMRDAQPGLVHLNHENAGRLTKVEEAIVELRHVVGIYTEVLKRVDLLENRVGVIETTHVKDIVVAAERAATAAAAAEMFRLVGERDTLDAPSTELPQERA